jgi:hypothetical protein
LNKVSKTQRDQIVGIAVGTVGLMGLLWYLGVTAKQEELSHTEQNTAQMQDKLNKANNVMRKGGEIADKLEAREQLLDKREAILAPDRDAYAWIISTISPFLQTRKGVTINRYSQPEVSDAGLIPSFPYKWATFHLEGTGYFHDLGGFFADLENEFPAFRVQNLEMNANGGSGVEAEKLNVTFDLVVPVKATDTK